MTDTLFSQIGEDKIVEVITAFYEKAFTDPMISHFFFSKDKAHLTQMQILFSSVMLGSKTHKYSGKPLKAAHSGLPFRTPHFDRRQVLMKETLIEKNVAKEAAEKWLEMEEKFRPLIITDSGDCSS